MGSGDIVFLLLSAWGWSTTIFLTAYLSGLVVALLLAIGLQRGKPAGDFPIPLLTALGFSFGSVLAVHWYF
jgi:ABC-type Mn2+/Zn2+ transport system permease subunit